MTFFTGDDITTAISIKHRHEMHSIRLTEPVFSETIRRLFILLIEEF